MGPEPVHCQYSFSLSSTLVWPTEHAAGQREGQAANCHTLLSCVVCLLAGLARGIGMMSTRALAAESGMPESCRRGGMELPRLFGLPVHGRRTAAQ